MKTKKRIMSIISVLMILFTIPLTFPYSVSGATSIEEYKNRQYFENYVTISTGDWEGVNIGYRSDFGSNRCIFPVIAGGADGSYDLYISFDLSTSATRIKYLGYCAYTTVWNKFLNSKIFYVYSFSESYVSFRNKNCYIIQCAFSSSPMHYTLSDNKYVLSSDSDIVHISALIPVNFTSSKDYSVVLSSSGSYGLFEYPSNCTDIYQSYYKEVPSFSQQYPVTLQELYTNCDDLSFNGNQIQGDCLSSKSLSDLVDVTLTPEFGLNMDRTVPNSAFNTSQDYWKIDIENNNDFAIQFKVYILPATGAVQYVEEYSKSENLKEYSKNIPVLINTDDFIPKVDDTCLWMLEKNQWVYSRDVSNQGSYYNDEILLTNKPTSCFYLKSGGTFSQMIKWNQLNLNKNQPYQLFVVACQCPYDHASTVSSSVMSEDYSQECYHILKEQYFIVSNIEFSVKNPLAYDSSENYGGVISNTGLKQVDDDSWKVNAIVKDGETQIINTDYGNGWRLHPNGQSVYDHFSDDEFNLEDVGIDDVKNIISFTQDYFKLIRSVINVFPSWVWNLIFFGILSLVVIGIVKSLL